MKMRNIIIIRVPVGNGDATFITNRMEYTERYKKGDKIIFAMEYEDEETALRELQSW